MSQISKLNTILKNWKYTGGTIPDSGNSSVGVDSSVNITFIKLQNQNLEGDIKDLNTGDFPKLDTLWLFSNSKITGDIKNLSALTNLSILYLSQTSITGDIKDFPTALTNLNYLDLSQTSITGDIATLTTVKFPNLIAQYGQLLLSKNKLTGVIPSDFSKLSRLDLSYNCLTMTSTTADTFKSSELYKGGNYTDATKIPYLNLDYNCITGITGFNGISNTNCSNCSNCGNSQLCSINDILNKWNYTHSTLPITPSNQTDIIFDKGGNITDIILSHLNLTGLMNELFLTDFPKLKTVNLSENPNLTGSLSSLSSWKQNNTLIELNLSGTKLVGDIKDTNGIKTLTNIEKLELDNTEIKGSILDIPSLSKLTTLSLSGIGLTGDINTINHSLTQKENSLDLSNNNLIGDIPSIMNDLNNLDLSQNCLTMTEETANEFKSSDLYNNNKNKKGTPPYLNLNMNCISLSYELNVVKINNCKNCKNCVDCETVINSISITDTLLTIKYT